MPGIQLVVFQELQEAAQHDPLRIALVAGGVLAAQFQGAGVLVGDHARVQAYGLEGGGEHARAAIGHAGQVHGPALQVADLLHGAGAQSVGGGRLGQRAQSGLGRFAGGLAVAALGLGLGLH